MDQGLVPMAFTRPPHGAMAGLALVNNSATHPDSAARRVKYAAIPKWLEFRIGVDQECRTPIGEQLRFQIVAGNDDLEDVDEVGIEDLPLELVEHVARFDRS